MDHRIAITDLAAKKKKGEKIVMFTVYDYPTARLVDEAGVDISFIGDTLGMVVLGYDSTLPVTMDDILHHTKAVARGTKRAHVLADMPFLSYQVSPEDAIRNAGRLLQEGGAQSVKLEGGIQVADTVRRIVDAGIPVMGHLGLTPQSIHQLGGYKIQGKTPKAAVKLLNDAVALEQAGAYAIVLECVPVHLAKAITDRVGIPTIGIGAGPDCDGQVQVFHDLLGLYQDFLPKHARRYAHIGDTIRDAVRTYAADVRSGRFPTHAESFIMDTPLFSEPSEAAQARSSPRRKRQTA
jgi:3-methyl-2-oxobutanoate hydroxymethyltransferase